MAKKEELFKMENEDLGERGSESGNLCIQGGGIYPYEEDGTGMGLNGLPGGTELESGTDAFNGDEALPEISEAEMFGEEESYAVVGTVGGMDVAGDGIGDGTFDGFSDGDGSAVEHSSVGEDVIVAESPRVADTAHNDSAGEPAPAKTKRASRRKKADAPVGTAEEAVEVQNNSADSLADVEVTLVTEAMAQDTVDGEADKELASETAELPVADTETSVESALESEGDMFVSNSEGADTELDSESGELPDGCEEAEAESEEQSGRTVRQSESPIRRTRETKKTEAPILTLEVRGEVETEDAREEVIWHEIHNAYRTRRILTGQLGGIEQTDNGKTVSVVDYKGFRIVIPLKEMMVNVGRNPSGQEYTEMVLRQNKILGNMLGAEIDFIVRGIDSNTRSVVASRREAMLKKRQTFYLDTDAAGMHRIYEGRLVQARVIAVAEKVVRVEVFGVECSIMARDLAWDWIGDAHERFSVGDQVLVRILSVRRDSLEDISVKADVKSVSQNTSHENLKKCRIQSKYAGKVTDVHKGVVYIRLSNGVNAVAHSCYDYRTPGKKDDVSFAVTRIDAEHGVAVGIITRIIRQNL